MHTLQRFLSMINLKWAKKAKLTRALTIQKGTGNYPYLSVNDGTFLFHAYPHMSKFDTSTVEEVKNSFIDSEAAPDEVEAPFRADYVNSITNFGSEDIYINFNDSTYAPGTMTIKGGETVDGFPRKVTTIAYRSSAGYQPFEVLGVYTNLPYYQEVVAEGMTVRQLVDTIVSLGYLVDFTEAERSGIMDETALLFLDAEGVNISEDRDLFAFTSNWHRVLYPVNRLLEDFGGDVNTAIEQLMLPSTRGEWLDYWASFFRIKRLPEETDELMLRRVMLTLMSAKSNNVAMEELISFYIGTETKVLDNAPSQIEVRVSPQFMETAEKVREIIALLKGAGVDYFLNYLSTFEESYPAYFRDIRGGTFGTLNETYQRVELTTAILEEDYMYIPPELRNVFALNTSSNLNSSTYGLSVTDKKVIESVTMTMTDSSGAVIQRM